MNAAINPEPFALTFRPMTLEDIDEVLAIEQKSFFTPWSRNAFVGELTQNPLALYLVGHMGENIVCYAGSWLIHGEAHITNIAVHPNYRGLNIGEAMCRSLLVEVAARGMVKATLEVRVSNTVAQNLYRKLGFNSVGVRPGYYTDTNEDAIIMWKDNIDKPEGDQ